MSLGELGFASYNESIVPLTDGTLELLHRNLVGFLVRCTLSAATRNSTLCRSS